ncbi:MAG: heme NO-binding domain-containing protein [Pseudomonadota bacterium]
MYGMVNHGIQTFVTENYGEADWRDICARAGLKQESFEGMLTYPDEVTYKLVGALSEKYDLTAEAVLQIFGDYWVDYSAKTSIGKLMRFSGKGLSERLATLNDLHDRIKMSMPHLQPPSFEFEEGEGNEHKLHYASERDGLESMVIGLV